MTETVRLLLLLALAGALVTFVGSAFLWFGDEQRSLRRAMTRVLKGPPEAMIIAHGRGRAAGFNFAAGVLAVAWDKGAWCLIYKLGELMGGELVVDGQVLARAYRGEPRRALEQRLSSAGQVTLRLIFDDARHPDFDLVLWLTGDEARREAGSPGDAITEANRWLTRIEAILRRPPENRTAENRTAEPRVAPPPPPAAPPPPTPPPPPPRPAAVAPPIDDIDDEDAPPWQPDLLDDEHN